MNDEREDLMRMSKSKNALTAEIIRQTLAYVQAGLDHDDGYPFVMHVYVDEFDRWLAQIKAEAWDEGYKTCDQVWVETGDITTPDEYRTDPRNPYRKVVE